MSELVRRLINVATVRKVNQEVIVSRKLGAERTGFIRHDFLGNILEVVPPTGAEAWNAAWRQTRERKSGT